MTTVIGAQGVYPTLRGQPSTAIALQAGGVRLIPAGTWNIGLDPFSCVQQYDPIQGQWCTIGGESSILHYVNSDGVNYRIANLVGCVVGGMVTTAGSSYTVASGVTFVPSAGGSTFTALIGGAVGTSPTVTNGGTNYQYNPLVFIDPPGYGSGNNGLQATGYATISNGAVSSITIDNQGAGYITVPNIYIINDPRDTQGAGASATATLTGAGTVTGLLCTNPGTPLATLPTFTITSSVGSGAAATAIMVRTISAYTVTTSGSGYSGTVEITALGSGLSGSPALANPRYTTNLVRTRAATIIASISAGGITSSGQTVIDGGIYAGSSPTALIIGGTQGASPVVGTVGFSWAVPTTPSDVFIYPV